VQVTFLRALDHVEGFEPQGQGAFLAYLRRILQNAIRDHVRAVTRRPQAVDLPDSLAGEEPSPLERAIGRERLARYEEALAKLRPAQQEAVVLRIELGLTHAEVAESMGLASANAARMQVARALVQLAEAMDER